MQQIGILRKQQLALENDTPNLSIAIKAEHMKADANKCGGRRQEVL